MEDLPEFARPMLTRLCAGDAKQEATVQRRVEKVLARLSAGDGLHDQYRK